MTRNATLPAPRRRPAAGFTLIELVLTVFVLGTAFVAGTWSMSAVARTKAAYDKEKGPAAFLAREIMTLADSLPREPSGMIGATSAAGVLALDSLIGASFCPPIMADGSLIPDLYEWRQNVALTVYELDSLTTPMPCDPADGVPPESAQIYKLDVSILHEGQVVDGFSWWIHP